MCIYFTLMLHVINQAINRWNQSIKHIQTIKQSTDASINQAIKQSISDAACVCVCMCMWHVLAECVVCLCMCIQIKHNKPITSITSSKHGLYTIHTYMHVYIMCALCVCEMHAHACALHLCIALLCVHLSAWDCSQQALLQNVKKSLGTLVMETKNKHKL